MARTGKSVTIRDKPESIAFPLPTDHWIYQEQDQPAPIDTSGSEESHALRLKIREALKYTISVCTSRGKDMDFDPDAMWMTLEHTLFTARSE